MASPYNFQDYEGAEMEALFHKIESLGPATNQAAGTMSAADKSKLDGVASGAQVNVIEGIKLNDTDLVPVAKIISILIDNAAVSGSANPISSGAVYTELAKYYTKTQVNTLIAAIKQFTYEVVAELPTASAETMYCIYFVPSSNPKTQNIKDEYITVRTGSEGSYVYSWEQIGTTAVDISGKADKDPDAVEGNIAKFDSNGNPVDGGIPANNVAQKDGYYEKLGAGTAKYIEGETPVTGSFMERTTGGDAEVANGLAQITEVAGKSQVWNQLCSIGLSSRTKNTNGVTITDNRDGTYTVSTDAEGATQSVEVGTTTQNKYIAGHKYYMRGCPTGGSRNGYSLYISGSYITSNENRYDLGDGQIFTIQNDATSSYPAIRVLNGATISTPVTFKPVLVDLTLLGIDNLTTVAEVEAWLAKNIGLKAYYPYNAGEVLNNKMEGLESTNRNLLDPATGKARIIGAYSDVYGNYYGITGTHGALTFTSDLGETSEITPDSDGKFLLEEPGWLNVATPGVDCAVFLWWDGTKTDYVEHKVSKAYVDVTHIWGKLNGTGELVQVFPDGMAGLPSVKDILRNEGGVAVARKRMGKVDMGTLTWAYNATYLVFTSSAISGMRQVSGTSDTHFILSSKYATSAIGTSGSPDKSIYPRNVGTDAGIGVKDSAYTDAATFKVAMNGIPLYFELATEEVYTDLVYQGSDHFADGTPVTLPVPLEIDNWGIERAIPQNDESLVTSAPEVSIRYSVDVAEEMNTIHDSGIFAEDLRANLNAVLAVVNEKLATAMGGTISLGSTPVDKVYPVIFTPTPEPDSNNE